MYPLFELLHAGLFFSIIKYARSFRLITSWFISYEHSISWFATSNIIVTIALLWVKDMLSSDINTLAQLPRWFSLWTWLPGSPLVPLFLSCKWVIAQGWWKLLSLTWSTSGSVCWTECVCSSGYACLVILCSKVSCLLPKSLAHGGLVLPPPPSTQPPLVFHHYLPSLLIFFLVCLHPAFHPQSGVCWMLKKALGEVSFSIRDFWTGWIVSRLFPSLKSQVNWQRDGRMKRKVPRKFSLLIFNKTWAG